jgi:methionyl-tRNA synthetase
MQSFLIHLYVGAVFDVVAQANRYFANAEPWKLNKTDPKRMRLVLYVTIETLRIAAILLQPIMPGSMGRMLDLLAVPPDARTFASLETGEAAGLLDAPHRLEPGKALPPPTPIFPRYVEPEAAAL